MSVQYQSVVQTKVIGRTVSFVNLVSVVITNNLLSKENQTTMKLN